MNVIRKPNYNSAYTSYCSTVLFVENWFSTIGIRQRKNYAIKRLRGATMIENVKHRCTRKLFGFVCKPYQNNSRATTFFCFQYYIILPETIAAKTSKTIGTPCMLYIKKVRPTRECRVIIFVFCSVFSYFSFYFSRRLSLSSQRAFYDVK